MAGAGRGREKGPKGWMVSMAGRHGWSSWGGWPGKSESTELCGSAGALLAGRGGGQAWGMRMT